MASIVTIRRQIAFLIFYLLVPFLVSASPPDSSPQTVKSPISRRTVAPSEWSDADKCKIWPTDEIPYCFHIDFPDELKPAVELAISKWTERDIPVTFRDCGSCPDAFRNGEDQGDMLHFRPTSDEDFLYIAYGYKYWRNFLDFNIYDTSIESWEDATTFFAQSLGRAMCLDWEHQAYGADRYLRYDCKALDVYVQPEMYRSTLDDVKRACEGDELAQHRVALRNKGPLTYFSPRILEPENRLFDFDPMSIMLLDGKLYAATGKRVIRWKERYARYAGFDEKKINRRWNTSPSDKDVQQLRVIWTRSGRDGGDERPDGEPDGDDDPPPPYGDCLQDLPPSYDDPPVYDEWGPWLDVD